MSKDAKMIRILSLKNQLLVADQCCVAESFFDRLRGLIGKKVLNEGQGLLLSPCNDIHMWMMSIPIDVVFLKRREGNTFLVTSIRENLKPWRLLPVRDGKATDTLELPIGTLTRCELKPGDELCIN